MSQCAESFMSIRWFTLQTKQSVLLLQKVTWINIPSHNLKVPLVWPLANNFPQLEYAIAVTGESSYTRQDTSHTKHKTAAAWELQGVK